MDMDIEKIRGKLAEYGKLISLNEVTAACGLTKAAVSLWSTQGLANVGKLTSYDRQELASVLPDGVTREDQARFDAGHTAAVKLVFVTKEVMEFIERKTTQQKPDTILLMLMCDYPTASQDALAKMLYTEYGITKSRSWVGIACRRFISERKVKYHGRARGWEVLT